MYWKHTIWNRVQKLHRVKRREGVTSTPCLSEGTIVNFRRYVARHGYLAEPDDIPTDEAIRNCAMQRIAERRNTKYEMLNTK
jgi:hypothetical protein